MSFTELDHYQGHNLALRLYTMLSLKFPDEDISELKHDNYLIRYDFPRNLLSVYYDNSFVFVASYAPNHKCWYEIDTQEISGNEVDILYPITEQVIYDLNEIYDYYVSEAVRATAKKKNTFPILDAELREKLSNIPF
jgi:hypothetical protein